MKNVTFGTIGVQLSEMCLGTMMFGDRYERAESDWILARATKGGVNFIDTVASYVKGKTETNERLLMRPQRLPCVIRLLLALSLLLGTIGLQPSTTAVATSNAEENTPAATDPNDLWAYVEFKSTDSPPGNVGIWPAIAINPTTQQPYVVYADATRDKMYAAARQVNGGGNCGPSNTWQCSIYDNNYGSQATSLDFKANGTPVVSYNLKSSGWVVVNEVDSNNQLKTTHLNPSIYHLVRFSSLKLAADETWRVVYHGYMPYWSLLDEFSLNELRYAYTSPATGLQHVLIDNVTEESSTTEVSNGYFPSLNISYLNQPAIAYRYQGAPGGIHQLKYTEYAGDSTACSKDENGNNAGVGWHCYVVDPSAGSGNYISLHVPQSTAVGEGTRIAYYNANAGEVRVARYTGNSANNCGAGGKDRWRCSKIDSVGTGGTMGISLGEYLGNSSVAYYDKNDPSYTHGILKLATYLGPDALFANCGYGAEANQWLCEVVDNGGASKQNVGQYTSIAHGKNGRTYIAYYNATNGSLKVAYQRSVVPTFSKTQFPTTVALGENSTVTYTLENGNVDTLSGITFSDLFPSQSILPETIKSTCTGSLQLYNSNRGIRLQSGALKLDSSCTISLQVKAEGAGTFNSTSTWLRSNEAQPAPALNASVTITAPKQAQTITFAALADKFILDGPFSVTASATSGLSVAISSQTPAVCTVAGNTVTLQNAGACILSAAQSGSLFYFPATSVKRSFAVNSLALTAQTITFAALPDKTVADPPFALAATASSGLAVTFASETPAICTVASDMVTVQTTGVCTIAASQAGNGSFNAAATQYQSFTVDKASQTITFAPLPAKTLGDLAFSLSASSSSGLPVTFESDTQALCSTTGSTVTLLAIGTCVLRAAQEGNGVYHPAADVLQSFAIALPAKQNQTIQFEPISEKTLGIAPFTVNAEASSNLPISISSNTLAVCTVSGMTVNLLATGLCTLTAVQAGNANFLAAETVTQSFTVKVPVQNALQVYLPIVAK